MSANLTTEQRQEFAHKAWETMNTRKVEVNPDDVTFGIEIECLIPADAVRRLGIVAGGYHRGYELPDPFPAGWNAQHDSSLHPDFSSQVAVEIVSPVLHGLEGLQEVVKVGEILAENGAKANTSCGCHVHIGVRSVLGNRSNDYDLVADFVRRLLNLVSIHEFGLAAITGSRSRLNNQYCRSIKSPWSGKLKAGDKWDKVNHEAHHLDGSYDFHNSRYHVLNLNNLFEYKMTVEFRIFGGTVNYKKMLSYIVTAIGLCQRAAETPIAPQFNSNTTEPTDWKTEVAKLQKALRFDSSTHCLGFPTGAWAEYHTQIVDNQKWNTDHFIAGVN